MYSVDERSSTTWRKKLTPAFRAGLSRLQSSVRSFFTYCFGVPADGRHTFAVCPVPVDGHQPQVIQLHERWLWLVSELSRTHLGL